MLYEDESRALKKELASRLHKDLYNLTTPDCSSPTPFGTLSILPRELRDEIYRHLLNRQWPYYFNDSHYGDIRKWMGDGLFMLSVCKAIREEFLTVLCSERFFELHHYSLSDKIQHSDIPFLYMISNVIIGLDVYPMSDNTNKFEPSITKPEPISFFNGTSVMRNVCLIELYRCMPGSLLSLLKSPLMHAMSELTGFKTVRLTFSTYKLDWLEYDDGLSEKARQHIRETFYSLETCPGFDDFVLRTSNALEPTLGYFAVTRVSWIDESGLWGQRVTFHPRGHPTKRLDRFGGTSYTQAEVVTNGSASRSRDISVLDFKT